MTRLLRCYRVPTVAAMGPARRCAEARRAHPIAYGDARLEMRRGEYSIATGKGSSLKISSTGMYGCAFIVIAARNRNLETMDLQGTLTVK